MKTYKMVMDIRDNLTGKISRDINYGFEAKSFLDCPVDDVVKGWLEANKTILSYELFEQVPLRSVKEKHYFKRKPSGSYYERNHYNRKNAYGGFNTYANFTCTNIASHNEVYLKPDTLVYLEELTCSA
tara:strand:- start:1561 stop:1944 length:384 start_codon:yes stop_codon:yes gene_type:complete